MSLYLPTNLFSSISEFSFVISSLFYTSVFTLHDLYISPQQQNTVWIGVNLELIPGTLGVRWEQMLDWTPVHHRAPLTYIHTLIHSCFEKMIQLLSCFEGFEKQGNQEETNMGTGRTFNTPQRPSKLFYIISHPGSPTPQFPHLSLVISS